MELQYLALIVDFLDYMCLLTGNDAVFYGICFVVKALHSISMPSSTEND